MCSARVSALARPKASKVCRVCGKRFFPRASAGEGPGQGRLVQRPRAGGQRIAAAQFGQPVVQADQGDGFVRHLVGFEVGVELLGQAVDLTAQFGRQAGVIGGEVRLCSQSIRALSQPIRSNLQ